MNILDIHKVAYLAGLLDGEGCFGISLYNRKYRPRITMASTNREVLTWVTEHFFGGVHVHHIGSDKAEDAWEVTLGGNKNLIVLLSAIIPFLIIKRANAEVLLKFCKEFPPRPGCTLSAETLRRKEMYFQVARLLNSRGPGSNDVKLEVVNSMRT